MPIIKYKKHMKVMTYSILLLVALFLFGCVHIESPHTGFIKDAETDKPIKNVVVHLDLETVFFVPAPHVNTKWKDGFEVLSNEAGIYKLPFRVIGQGPLELSAGQELSFIKAGYFPTRILDPAMHNSVDLYPIRYYLDYVHHKDSAQKGDWGAPHYYMDNKPEAFTEYKKELTRMAAGSFEKLGEKGVFISVPTAQITRISCRTKFPMGSTYRSKPDTFGIFGNICLFYDEVSRKSMISDARGNIKTVDDASLSRYNLISIAPNEENTVYANADSIYIPNPPYSNTPHITQPQKGNISALAGDSNEYLTLEDNGLYMCYSSIWHRMGNGCISVSDVFSNNGGKAKFILLTHGYSPDQDHVYFVISKKAFQYQIHKVTHESDSGGNTKLTFTEQLVPSFPADDEIIDFASDGRIFFIAFKKSGLKKYSLDMYRKGPLKEESAFYEKCHDLFADKTLVAIKLGRSASERVLYVTAGDSAVYRLSLDGEPDYRIRIIE
jgi:hypothetical protein